MRAAVVSAILVTAAVALLSSPAAPIGQSREASREAMLDAVRAMAAAAEPGGRRLSPRVVEAMRQVPRHEFVPPALRARAYENRPLPIGDDQTISQPYIVALMTDLLRPGPADRVLEIGTGSGYQAAILSRLVARVHSIEIIERHARAASARLAALGYGNVEVRHGDGYAGWPERAPFDAIIVTAGADHVPAPLVAQLKPGGRMVIPVGRGDQELLLLEKRADGSVRRRSVLPVAFVPFTRGGPR